MKEILINVCLGMIPEILFFTIFLITTKNIKSKKIKLLGLVTTIYVACIMIKQYQTLYYVVFIALLYLSLIILYKKETKIIDIFVISIASIYLTLDGFLCSRFLSSDFSNYYYILIINRILLFLPFIWKQNFNIVYKKYKSLWDRNDKEKRPIKSITLRNISLIIANSFIFILNIFTISIINFIE